MPIRQITIVGTGLIGGSFALALRKRRFAGRIVGCDREASLKRAKTLGVIDSGCTNPSDAVRGSQLVVLATPVLAIVDLIGRLGPSLPTGTLLTDVGSTKAAVAQQALKVFGKNAGKRFLGGHPMAGKEQQRRRVCRCRLVPGCGLVPDAVAGAKVCKTGCSPNWWSGLTGLGRALPYCLQRSTTGCALG